MVTYVVNPLLWYIFQRIKQMTLDMLCKIIIQYYSSVDIETAKELLFDHFLDEVRPKHLRKKARQGAHKLENTIKDMVDVFHELAVTKSFIPPIFVTDTCHFPSLDLANVDAVSMATEIMQLKKDINSFKENKETEKSVLKEIQDSLQAIRSSINLIRNKNQVISLNPHKDNYNQPSYASVIKSHINMSDNINLQKNSEIFFSQNLVDTSKSEWTSVSQKRFRSKIKVGKNIFIFEELRGFRINFLNKLHKDEKHQTRVSLSLELISDAYLTAIILTGPGHEVRPWNYNIMNSMYSLFSKSGNKL